MDGSHILIDGKSLTTAILASLAMDFNLRIRIDPEARSRVISSRKLLDQMVKQGRVIYGVNTSMGGFVNWLIPIENARELQENLISAVASNVGNYLPDEVVRAAMVARINSLARGTSAISIENLDKMVAIFNAGIVPLVGEQGSLGASGDLGPLAMIALACAGKWKARYKGEVIAASQALKAAGIEPMVLNYKEGLAMINGTSVMAGFSALLIEQAIDLLKAYDLISALSFEALHGAKKPFDPIVHLQKPHYGQLVTATNIFNLLADSRMIVDEAETERALSSEMSDRPRSTGRPIEDAYSVRCTPQILGPVRDSLRVIQTNIQNEINSSNDNPLILPNHEEVFHNGHFHGQYISMSMDHLSIGLTTLCNLSERRIDRFLDKGLSNGLPAFLCRENPGLRLGLMGGQFMSTSLTAETRSLCVPLSIQTLTSTADFQDIVSMGLIATRRAQMILKNVRYVIAFELICAAQGADIRGPEQLSTPTRKLHDLVRKVVPYLDRDEMLTLHIENAAQFVQSEALRELANTELNLAL